MAYLKSTPVDLTPRLKGSISAAGINFLNAEVPAGKHALKVTVNDLDGRETSSVVTPLSGKQQMICSYCVSDIPQEAAVCRVCKRR